MTFRVRLLAPRETPWVEVEAASWQDAANGHHMSFGRDDHSLSIEAYPSAVGRRWYFARVEVEGHEPTVSRWRWDGLVRRGGVRRGREVPWEERLAGIAARLGWEGAAVGLVEAGWEGEDAGIFEDDVQDGRE